MYLVGLTSLFDELSWRQDAYGFPNSLFKIEAGTVARGAIAGFDTDYYQLVVPYAGAFSLRVSNDSVNGSVSWTTGTVNVSIVDSTGQTLLSGSAFGTVDAAIAFSLTQADSTSYWVKLTGFTSASYVAELVNFGPPSQPVNHAPVASIQVPNQTAPQDSPFFYAIQSSAFTDPDGDTLTYSLSRTDGALPAWLKFNATLGTFSGTPTGADIGSYSLRLTATDPGGLSTFETFVLNVAPVDDYAANASTSGRVVVGGVVSGAINFVGDIDWFRMDLVAGNKYVFDLKGAPSGNGTLADPWMALANAQGGVIAHPEQGYGNSSGSPDYGGTLDSHIEFWPTLSGTYYLGAHADSKNPNMGTYKLLASAETIPSLTIVPQSADKSEGFPGRTTPFTFVVTASGAYSQTINYAWSVKANSQANGADFETSALPSGAGQILSGTRQSTISIPVAGDGVYEPHESFTVMLTSADVAVTAAEARGQIRNDDPKPVAAQPAYGKDASFLFDPVYYLWKYPELAPTVTLNSAASQYLSIGAAQGKAPNNWFDPTYYANKWSDLGALHLDNATLFQHYNLFGVWEGRSAGPKFDHFDGARYLTENPDVASYVNANLPAFLGSATNGAIAHFIIYGATEQRIAHENGGGTIDMGYLI